MASPAAFAFPASRRVLRKADFDQAFRQGRRQGNALLSLVVRPNGLDHPRLGVALAAKVARVIWAVLRHETNFDPGAIAAA